MLSELSRMPAEMSSDSRRQLLNAVTDLFLLDEAPNEASQAHYGDIALKSLPHLEVDARRDYADRVAETPTLPRDVAVTLASDPDADVARLVLKLSPVLTDTDLAAIAVTQSQRHLVAIAERARLSESVTDILVERGDREVLHTVSANEGASLSEKGFDRLIERGGQDGQISLALSSRSDLTPNRAERVMRIVGQMSEDGTLWNKPGSEALSLARQARQQRLEIKLLMADLSAGTRPLDEIVTMLADEDRAFHLALVFAQVASLSTDQALRVLMQRDASGIAVACRALGVSTDAFGAVLKLRGRRMMFAKAATEDDLKSYAALDAATAERTMRFLKLKTRLS
ncbi:MAG TPA: DUF2336 domain-containing protein [Bosea sp. (in: a-proteobacteria)]|uniref:DUF2336 domain-containing protein n=1 Tax=Bosea sp. (in: a-proteobacteria) TaxID=1871050 RepID=UPI002DDD1863|nr:DUF2336 domain-containing protein [Bosea sp. (in: a-proteobacteria)]HEV2555971.1 DUF2336 domain-containing protein [Bosea sp. (in: a-proteobacteria)]